MSDPARFGMTHVSSNGDVQGYRWEEDSGSDTGIWAYPGEADTIGNRENLFSFSVNTHQGLHDEIHDACAIYGGNQQYHSHQKEEKHSKAGLQGHS
jgi:hypothetical protein